MFTKAIKINPQFNFITFTCLLIFCNYFIKFSLTTTICVVSVTGGLFADVGLFLKSIFIVHAKECSGQTSKQYFLKGHFSALLSLPLHSIRCESTEVQDNDITT